MSELKTLSVQKRSAFGKGANPPCLRVKALVPGVFYASDGTNVPCRCRAASEQDLRTGRPHQRLQSGN